MSDEIKTEMKDEVSNVTENISSATSKEENSAEVAPTNVKLTETELQTLDYADFDTPAKMLALGAVLCKSQLVPLKKPEDVVVALMTGKELGLGFVTSVSQIYPINGRPTLGVHIQRGILIKNGINIQKIEDAVSIYKFYEADEDGNAKTVSKKDGSKTLINIGEGTIEEQPPKSKRKEYTKRTTYQFTRKIRMADGTYESMKVKSSFTLIEAAQAGLTDKDVWIKYWRRMLDARAFSIGAREIADDLLLGMMSPNELSSNFYVNDRGEEVHKAEIVNE